MKKQYLTLAVLFLTGVLLFGQTIDKSSYRAIDPFDYRLEEESAVRGAVRKFKSVVQFSTQNALVYSFYSLDQGTLLALKSSKTYQLTAGQKLTVYFTATKGIIDTLVLDEIDTSNTAEAGIGLNKSAVTPSNIKRSDYLEIDPFDYKMEAETVQRDSVRKYKSTVLFSTQSGTTFSFKGAEGGVLLSLKVNRRFNPLVPDQKVTIYYTATKGIVDALILDDIEY
ncbi:MAG: hypothetical protein LBD48_00635 [Treponema sp.]|jgi:hypothetical protein|nr:hypothetical protein [Treponema sp.]